MRVDLIYATWPVTPFGATWHKLAGSLRDAGLKQALTEAGHEVEEYQFAVTGPSASELRGGFELGAAIAERVRTASMTGALPVIVCGSCGVSAIGAAAGLAGGRTGILWLDAHPDLNTPETSGSGMFDGMALATALGLCWSQMGRHITGVTRGNAADACLFGARDIDPGEAELIAEHKVAKAAGPEEAVRHLRGCDRIYIHLDMDVHDALQVRANSFAVPGGPGIEAVRQAITETSRQLPLAALSLTGLDPAAPDAALAIETAIAHIRAVCDSRSAA